MFCLETAFHVPISGTFCLRYRPLLRIREVRYSTNWRLGRFFRWVNSIRGRTEFQLVSENSNESVMPRIGLLACYFGIQREFWEITQGVWDLWHTLNPMSDQISIQYRFVLEWRVGCGSLSLSNRKKRTTDLKWINFINVELLCEMVRSKNRFCCFPSFPLLESSMFGFPGRLQVSTWLASTIIRTFLAFHLNQGPN
jgi:hypothetical protein